MQNQTQKMSGEKLPVTLIGEDQFSNEKWQHSNSVITLLRTTRKGIHPTRDHLSTPQLSKPYVHGQIEDGLSNSICD